VLKFVGYELKRLAGRCMELGDGWVRAVNGWMDMVGEMAGWRVQECCL
jgi:hypothetical protein